MLQGEGITELVRLLEQRRAYLYHACQLVDFQSYLNLGGIPSRAYLESMEQCYTVFDTDPSDHTNNVWNKVFANLSDFGFTFAWGGAAVPNTYGPIVFQVKPEALFEATDVAICLRSAGGDGFNREREALKSVQDVDRLFQHPVGESKSQYVKTRQELEKEFKQKASAPEISCTVESGRLSLQYVSLVRVEPYIIRGQRLLNWVEELKSNSGERFRVFERDRTPSYKNELVDILAREMPSLPDLSQNLNLSPELRDWAKRVIDRGIEYQFKRFAKYLRNGTLLPIL